jgi:type IV pilus assembly protein PilM
MALTLPFPRTKKRTQAVAIDLGARMTKAVHIQRRGEGFELLQCAVLDAPVLDTQPLSVKLLAEHLKKLAAAVGVKNKQIVLMAGVNDALLRHAELPLVTLADMRLMLKFNTKNYLQQDLPDHVFDCYLLPFPAGKAPIEMGKQQKCRALVGAARKDYLEVLQAASKDAGLVADQVSPGMIGTANAFEFAQPEIFAKEVVALVDLGFRSSMINIIAHGELVLSRMVAIGGDKLTAGLAEGMGISYAEAEGIKVGMPEEVQSALLPLLMPLGRELRASIDFFEHQQDQTVTQVFVSGGAARSRSIIEALQSEMMVPCHPWNPLSFLRISVPPQQLAEIETLGPQLAVAVGGAMALLA